MADWRERGHEAVAVVHMQGEEVPQPHLHVLVAARPVRHGEVDKSVRMLANKAAVKVERARVAELDQARELMRETTRLRGFELVTGK